MHWRKELIHCNPESRKAPAGKAAIRLARDCILHRRCFSIELTLAGGTVIRLMHDVKASEFEITSCSERTSYSDCGHYQKT
jgi:predicted ABC-type ATPase